MYYENKIAQQFHGHAASVVPLPVLPPTSMPFPLQYRMAAYSYFKTIQTAQELQRACQHYLVLKAHPLHDPQQEFNRLVEFATALKKSNVSPYDEVCSEQLYMNCLVEALREPQLMDDLPPQKKENFFSAYAENITKTKIHGLILKSFYSLIDGSQCMQAMLSGSRPHSHIEKEGMVRTLQKEFTDLLKIKSTNVVLKNSSADPPGQTLMSDGVVMRIELNAAKIFSPVDMLIAWSHENFHLAQARAIEAFEEIQGAVSVKEPDQGRRSLKLQYAGQPHKAFQSAMLEGHQSLNYGLCMIVARGIYPVNIPQDSLGYRSNAMEIEAYAGQKSVTNYLFANLERRKQLHAQADALIDGDNFSLNARRGLHYQLSSEAKATGYTAR